MAKTDKIRIAKILSIISKRIISDKSFLSELECFLLKTNEKPSTNQNDLENIDIFSKFINEGKDSLLLKLQEYNVDELITIIKRYKLDASKLSYKWKKKDRLINFIIDQIVGKMEKGESFLEYKS